MFKKLEKTNEKSLQYIEDNKGEVARNNQRTLVMLNVFYLIVLISFIVLSWTTFSSWGVFEFYMAAAVLQVFFLVFVLARYGTDTREWTEVNLVCTIFQIYAMTFVGVMSIFPIEMHQPAVYFAPIGMAFVAVFVFSYRRTRVLAVLEMILYIIASGLLKEKDVFVIDACSSTLALVMAFFLIRILWNHRIRENETRQQIRRMGMIDQLTGLYNKASTEFLCTNYLKSETFQSCAMMVLDFDNFKNVNDTFGHQAGDVVLREFGRILREEIDEKNITGRFGGDEFFAVIKHTDADNMQRLAERILNRTRMIGAPNGEKPFSCSIGIALEKEGDHFDNPSHKFDELFSRADQVLYRVKDNGKNNYMLLS